MNWPETILALCALLGSGAIAAVLHSAMHDRKPRAPRRRRCYCTRHTGLPGRGYCGTSAPAPVMPMTGPFGDLPPTKMRQTDTGARG